MVCCRVCHQSVSNIKRKTMSSDSSSCAVGAAALSSSSALGVATPTVTARDTPRELPDVKSAPVKVVVSNVCACGAPKYDEDRFCGRGSQMCNRRADGFGGGQQRKTGKTT